MSNGQWLFDLFISLSTRVALFCVFLLLQQAASYHSRKSQEEALDGEEEALENWKI